MLAGTSQILLGLRFCQLTEQLDAPTLRLDAFYQQYPSDRWEER